MTDMAAWKESFSSYIAWYLVGITVSTMSDITYSNNDKNVTYWKLFDVTLQQGNLFQFVYFCAQKVSVLSEVKTMWSFSLFSCTMMKRKVEASLSFLQKFSQAFCLLLSFWNSTA